MKINMNQAKGFTLIEFIVASSLAIIVIMAASSTYFMTRQLNRSAQQRIDVQNSLRYAATLITRDARVAGNFGCFSTGRIISTTAAAANNTNSGAFPNISNIEFAKNNSTIRLDSNSHSGYGVIWTNNLTGITLPAGASAVSNALIFIYGKGNTNVTAISSTHNSATLANNGNAEIIATATERGPLVLSSCENAYAFSPNNINNTTLTFNPISNAANDISANNLSNLSVSKLQASAYVVALVNGVNSLLKYELGNNGEWLPNPQLLSANVRNMNVNFAYEQECDTTASIPGTSATFAYSNTLNARNLPALAQIRLTYDGATQDEYIINAAIRGGNQCNTIVNKG